MPFPPKVPSPGAGRPGARRARCLFGCAAILALTFAALGARAQDEDDGPVAAPLIVTINGPCVFSIGGRKAACQGVAYMLFPSNHRIDFAAITGNEGWAFSGETDDNQAGQYALSLDSVVGPSSVRTEAEGECDMEVGEDRRTVNSLQCRASTDAGEFVLTASGVIAVGGDDDDDDN